MKARHYLVIIISCVLLLGITTGCGSCMGAICGGCVNGCTDCINGCSESVQEHNEDLQQ